MEMKAAAIYIFILHFWVLQQTPRELMAFLFFRPVRFLFERFKDGISSLTTAFGQNYAPRTIIGTDHKWVHHDELKQSQPIIRKVHGKAVRVTFGPLYRELDVLKREKEEAWHYILRNSDDVGGEIETNDIYINAVRGIEVESRALYGDGTGNDPIASLTSDEFIWIMILDGCFLLQVALLVLEGRKQLGHPLDDPIFGEPGNKDLIRAAMSSMFIVGNQMPILVLKELMKQSFFKKVFSQGIWNQPPDLERWVLFELLLVPMLDMKGGAISIPTSLMPIYELRKVPSLPRKHFITIIKSAVESLSVKRSIELIFEIMFQIWFKWRSPSRKAHDLLHGLWLLMTGIAYSKENEDHIEGNCNHHYDVVSSTVRSATELDKAGIGLKYNKGTNISGISFETFMFNAFLILPQIVIDSQIETLFCNLIEYENTQELGETKQKICAYLQLMRELIRTPEDVKLLASNGVIIVDPSQEETLPKLFERLPIPRVKTDKSLEVVRVELNKHTYLAIMFKKLSNVLSIVIFLALVQTVYVILTYHQKR